MINHSRFTTRYRRIGKMSSMKMDLFSNYLFQMSYNALFEVPLCSACFSCQATWMG